MFLSFLEIEAGKPKPSRQPLPRIPFQFYPIVGSQSCGEKDVISCTCWKIGLYMVIPCHQPMVARLRFHQLLSFVPSCYISSKVFQKICTVPNSSWTMQPGRSHGTWHMALKYCAHDPPAYSNTSCEQQSEAPTTETQRPGWSRSFAEQKKGVWKKVPPCHKCKRPGYRGLGVSQILTPKCAGWSSNWWKLRNLYGLKFPQFWILTWQNSMWETRRP